MDGPLHAKGIFCLLHTVYSARILSLKFRLYPSYIPWTPFRTLRFDKPGAARPQY